MRRFRTLTLLFLASVFVGGCAVGPTAFRFPGVPITNPVERFGAEGFSVLPPSGANWFLEKKDGGMIVFGKLPYLEKIRKLKETIDLPTTRQELNAKEPWVVHTFVAAVFTKNYSDLLERPGGQRFKTAQVKGAVDNFLGQDCIKYSYTGEDHGSPHAPVFILTGGGFFFLHPESSNLIVNINYSQRFLPGGQPLPIEAELEPFLKSLMFHSIPRAEQSLSSRQERRKLLEALLAETQPSPWIFDTGP